MLDWDNGEISTKKEREIVVPLFDAAFAAPNKGTTILYWFRSLSTVLSSTENRRIQELFKAFEWFPVLFKADLIFKNFSRNPLNSSTFQACTNPVLSALFCLYVRCTLVAYIATKMDPDHLLVCFIGLDKHTFWELNCKSFLIHQF